MFKTFAFRSSKQVKFNAFGCIKNIVRLKLTRAMQILMTRCVPNKIELFCRMRVGNTRKKRLISQLLNSNNCLPQY